MTSAPAIEAAALSIAPRADGGFVLEDPVSGARVDVRPEPGGRYLVAGESRLYADAVAAIIGQISRAGGGVARVEPAHVAVAPDAVEAQVLKPRERAVVV